MQSDIFTYIDPSPFSLMENGPLTGKSVVIQPNMSVRDWPTEAGSAALERYIALEDATVVERLRQAGANIKGSSRMSEMGFGLGGDTGAQALADGIADIVLITDTLGEARVAASTIGAIGFKPSHGIVSRFGLIGLVPSMECYGVLANSLADISDVMRVIAGNDDHDLSMLEGKVPDFDKNYPIEESKGSLAVIQECFDLLSPEDSQDFDKTLKRLNQAGLNIEKFRLADFDLFSKVHKVIGSVEASSAGGKYDGVRYGHRTSSASNWNEMFLKSRGESFGLLVKTYMFQGAYFQFENYKAFENACRIRARLLKEIEGIFNKVDALILPTRRSNIPVDTTLGISKVYDAFLMTLLANVTGSPAISLPGLISRMKNDPGLQIIGPHLGDARLLFIASQLKNIAKRDI
ncbi:MAG: hypothetical protein JW786_03125 [Desulfobacterales bacterium]|nr:hypothetical protein [Desulfobacterales bacterium]